MSKNRELNCDRPWGARPGDRRRVCRYSAALSRAWLGWRQDGESGATLAFPASTGRLDVVVEEELVGLWAEPQFVDLGGSLVS